MQSGDSVNYGCGGRGGLGERKLASESVISVRRIAPATSSPRPLLPTAIPQLPSVFSHPLFTSNDDDDNFHFVKFRLTTLGAWRTNLRALHGERAKCIGRHVALLSTKRGQHILSSVCRRVRPTEYHGVGSKRVE